MLPTAEAPMMRTEDPLKLCRDDLGPRETLLYRVLVPVTCVIAVVGTAASGADIVKHFSSSGGLFAC